MSIGEIAAKLNCYSDSPYSVLIFRALDKKRKDIVYQLAKLNRSIVEFIDNSSDKTPLGYCASNGDLDLCTALLDCGCDVNKKDGQGWTALHHAAAAGHKRILRVLLKRGANSNAKTPQRRYTALHLAILSNHPHLVVYLIKNAHPLKSYKSLINCRDSCGRTILHMALEVGLNIKYFKKLINSGTRVDRENNLKQTPLLLAVNLNNNEAIRELIKKGANINAMDIYGQTPLSSAIEKKYEFAIKLLLRTQSLISLSGNYHSTALHLAVYKELDEETLSSLLTNTMEIEARDARGRTPLMLAIILNNTTAYNVLIAAGAKRPLDEWGYAAKKFAGHHKNWSILADLFGVSYRYNKNYDNLQIAIDIKNEEYLKILIENGEIIKDEHITTALYSKDINIINILLENYTIDETKRNCDSLFVAIISDFSEVAHALLLKGANPDYKQCLFEAVKNDSIYIIEKLIHFKADVHISDRFSCSLLWYAVDKCNITSAKLLLNAKCDPNFTHALFGQSLLQLAIIKNEPSMVQLLGEYGAKHSTETDELLTAILLKRMPIVQFLIENYIEIRKHHLEIAGMCCELIEEYLSKKVNLQTSRKISLSSYANSPDFITLKHQNNSSLKHFIEKLREQGIVVRFLEVTLKPIKAINRIYQLVSSEFYCVKMIFENHAEIKERENEIEEIFNTCRNHFLKYDKEDYASKILFTKPDFNIKQRAKYIYFDDQYEQHGSEQKVVLERSLKDLQLKITKTNSQYQYIFNPSPLHVAVIENKPEIVKDLLDAKIDFDVLDKNELTPFQQSIFLKHTDIINLFLEADAWTYSVKNLKLAILCEMIDIAKTIMKKYPITENELKVIDRIHNEKHKEEMLKALIEQLSEGGEDGNNAVLFAIEKGCLNILKSLLKIDGDLVNSQNSITGISILHIAVKFDANKFADVLIWVEEFGGELDLFCKKRKETALYKAIRLDRIDNAKLLIIAKADCSLGSYILNDSCLQLANDKRFYKLVTLMIKAGAKVPNSWPKKISSLLNLARISIRNSIPQKYFRKSIKSGLFKFFEDLLLFEYELWYDTNLTSVRSSSSFYSFYKTNY